MDEETSLDNHNSSHETDLSLTARLSYEASTLVAHLDAQPEEDGITLVVREAIIHHLGEVGLQRLEG